MVRNYDRINAQPPEGINEKRAHILGGGIAGLAAAAFLVDDAHMPGTNVTVYEASGTTGGAMDAAGGVPRLTAPAAPPLLNPGDCPGQERSRDARASRRLRRLRRNPAEQLQVQLHRRALAGTAGRRQSGRAR
ncbi:oleate hydratase [Streptomyces sp. NPDC003233]